MAVRLVDPPDAPPIVVPQPVIPSTVVKSRLIKGLVYATVTARGHQPGVFGPPNQHGERWAYCLNNCGMSLSLTRDRQHRGGMVTRTVRCHPRKTD